MQETFSQYSMRVQMGLDLMETEFCIGSTRVMYTELDLGFQAKEKTRS